MVAIQTYIDKDLFDRVLALGAGESRTGSALTSALSGQTSESRIQQSFRYGSQFYAKALSGLNFAASFVNFARADLEQVQSKTREMIEFAKESSEEFTSKQKRIQLNREYQRLSKDVREIFEGAKVGEREYLKLDGLQEVFVEIGLDPGKSRLTRAAFDEFQLADGEGNLASADIKGADTNLPARFGRPKPVQSTDELFGYSRDIARAADAQAVLDDLYAIDAQIEKNLEAMDGLTGLLSENLTLVRATAVSMIEISETIDSGTAADEAARLLQKALRDNVPQALNQVVHLEPIVVAALTLEQSGLVGEEE